MTTCTNMSSDWMVDPINVSGYVFGATGQPTPQCVAEIPRQARADREHSKIVILSLPKDLRSGCYAWNGESPGMNAIDLITHTC